MDQTHILELAIRDLEASFIVQCLQTNLLEERILELEGFRAQTAGPAVNIHTVEGTAATHLRCQLGLPPPPPPPPPLVTSIHVPTPPPSPGPIYAPPIKTQTPAPKVNTATPDKAIDPPYSSDTGRKSSRHLSQRPPTEKACQKTQPFDALLFPAL